MSPLMPKAPILQVEYLLGLIVVHGGIRKPSRIVNNFNKFCRW